MVEILARKNADITLPNSRGVTSLMAASFRGDLQVVNNPFRLVSLTDINIRDHLGNSALSKACVEGHRNIVEILLAKGADFSLYNNRGRTPLMAACDEGHRTLVSYLLGLDILIDINRRTEDGHTAFFLACRDGHLDVMEALLEKGLTPSLVEMMKRLHCC